jgi:hypothetical protein
VGFEKDEAAILKKAPNLMPDARVSPREKKRTVPTPRRRAIPTTIAPQDEVMFLNGMGEYGYSV